MLRKLRICCSLCVMFLVIAGMAFAEKQQDNVVVIDELPFKVVLFVIICAFCVVCVLRGISFLRKKSYENELEKKQKNFCGECNCSCTCNADCEGDVKKCTSQKAQEKQCVHCCDCFITPFMKAYGANLFGGIRKPGCENINR